MQHDELSLVGRRVGMVARWKPVHLGHAAVLEALIQGAAHVVIGIGSSNRHDARNPFTAAESATMIRLVLGTRDNYSLVEVPDLGNGPAWRQMVLDRMGPLDCFVTANAYVRSLLCDAWPVLHPAWLLPEGPRTHVDGSMVRRAMLEGGAWKAMVPPAVADYLDTHGLVERYQREFGEARP